MTFYWIRKKVIADFYISCNATVRNKYVFRYVSDISRINIQSWTAYWNFLWKCYIWQKIWVFHAVADDSSHNSSWKFTVETSKNAKYDSNRKYVSIKYNSHW